jgi:hypothetical protein
MVALPQFYGRAQARSGRRQRRRGLDILLASSALQLLVVAESMNFFDMGDGTDVFESFL